jgi:hypothetical protein
LPPSGIVNGAVYRGLQKEGQKGEAMLLGYSIVTLVWKPISKLTVKFAKAIYSLVN